MATEVVISADRRALHEIIDGLSDGSIGALVSYAAFLRHEEMAEELEEAEDIAYIEARKDEPMVSFEEVMAKYEAKYGPLD